MDNKNIKILLVDDESAFCELCSLWLEQAGYEVVACGDAIQAQSLYSQAIESSDKKSGVKKNVGFDLVIHDLSLPPSFKPEDGLTHISYYEGIPVVVLTGHDNHEFALKAMELGAWDFIAKPVVPELLTVIINRAIEKNRLLNQVQTLESELKQGHAQENDLGLVGVSQNIKSLRELVTRIAPTDVSVLIQGPSGTGKEIIANALHKLSLRAEKPFISVHCGAIPSDLLESELFGYKKGAFTGAESDRKGLLSMADSGTLFLDEIGEMPLAMQVKLLRVLQEGSFYPVGSRHLEKINFRLISATNRDLPASVQSGEFRDDLYYRIKGVTLTTLGLESRIEDISLLLKYFLAAHNQKNNVSLTISSQVLAWFASTQWPGNVRELKNTIESAAAICLTDVITIQDVQLIRHDIDLSGIYDGIESPIDSQTENRIENLLDQTLEQQVTALEIKLIKTAMGINGNNKTHTAQQLGITRQGLINKINRYQLEF